VRLRLLLGVALLVVAGTFALEMSGRAPRSAGSDHVSPAIFSATVPGGGVLCQPVTAPPAEAARAHILIGTYGHPVPDLHLRFLDAAGAQVAAGQTPAGAREGYVTIPLMPRHTASVPVSACLRVGGASPVVLGGEAGAPGSNSEVVDGHHQPGRISLLYLRQGDESWWQLLPVLDRRFGLGKASFFGEWTLPVVALLLLGVWVATARLLARELA